MKKKKQSEYLPAYHEDLAFAPLPRCRTRKASPLRTFFDFFEALLTILRITRSPDEPQDPHSDIHSLLEPKQLSNDSEVLSMCRPRAGFWLLKGSLD